MDLRFNSCYKAEMHPFVDALQYFIKESAARARLPWIVQVFRPWSTRKYWAAKALVQKTSHEVLQTRRSRTRKPDLLDAMLYNEDPKTGRLDDDKIVDNLVTFLAAGHETTAGLLSFLLFELITHPGAMDRARQEVDLLGAFQPQDLAHLPFINAPNPDEFIPERMLDENFRKLPSHAWKPFGSGSRSCIGRAFAWQEILITVVMLLQNFDFSLDDPEYKLAILSDLTLKPKGFKIRAKLRQGTATDLQQRLAGL